MADVQAAYLAIAGGEVVRQVFVSPSLLLDVRADGKIAGVETIGRAFDEAAMVELLHWLTLPPTRAQGGPLPPGVTYIFGEQAS